MQRLPLLSFYFTRFFFLLIARLFLVFVYSKGLAEFPGDDRERRRELDGSAQETQVSAVDNFYAAKKRFSQTQPTYGTLEPEYLSVYIYIQLMLHYIQSVHKKPQLLVLDNPYVVRCPKIVVGWGHPLVADQMVMSGQSKYVTPGVVFLFT